MDKTERNHFRSLINPTPAPLLNESPSVHFETEKYLAHTFFLPDIYQSPTLIERDVQIMTAQMGLLSLDTAPAPRLEDFPSAPSRDEPKKTGQNLNSCGNFKCPVCTKGFGTDKAMFGHMRIHQDKGSKDFKNPSIKKPKPDATLEPNRFLLRKLRGSWTVIKNQSSREMPDMEIQDEVTASILIDMSKSTWNGQSEKSRIVEFAPLEKEVAAILIDMPNLIRNSHSQKRRMPESAWLENKKRRIEESSPSEDKKYVCLTCNKTFPSHQALGGHCSSHKMLIKNAASLESVELQRVVVRQNSERKAKGGPHVCEICGESYPTGQQLGGHKRKHYGK